MGKRSIGIIGGGSAGTVLTWLLSPAYDVKLFEKEEQLGGHIFTYKAEIDGQEIPIDMGVDHINEKLCPNIFAMLRELKIDTFVAPLSMHVQIGKDSWSNVFSRSELRNRFVREFDNFHRDMGEIAANFDPKYFQITVAEFLKSKNYSDEFAKQALMPLLTSYYGCKSESLGYSVLYVAVSFDMNLLSFFTPGSWRKIKGGTSAYIEKIFKKISESVHLGTAVKKVSPATGGKVQVVTADGKKFEFDNVIFAASAKDSLNCIDCPETDYAKVLGGFGYVPISSTLHTNKDRHAKSGEYFSFYTDGKHEYGSLSRVNNNLYPYEKLSQPLTVTFDPIRKIKANVLCRKQWNLQTLRPIDGFLRSQVRNFQGKNNIWFCGTDMSMTGHEGAVVSAFVMADKFGVPYKFRENKAALAQFNTVRFIMGI